jgi:hypothetical protein
VKFTNEDLDGAISDLGMLKFFPSDPSVQGSIKAYLAKLCPHKEALRWLVATLVNQIGEWPGPAEVRRTLASRYRPADGDEGNRPTLGSDDIDWSRFPSHADEGALPPADLARLSRTTSAAPMLTGEIAPSMATAELAKFHNEMLGPLLAKPWPRGLAKPDGQMRAREEELARSMAETGRHLTDEQKASRMAEIEAAIGEAR